MAEPLNEIVDDLGLTTDDIAGCLRVHKQTVERWRRNRTLPQTEVRRRLEALFAAIDHLRDTFSTVEARRSWLRQPSNYLGGFTPVEAIRAGRVDRVDADLSRLDRGIFD